MDTLDNIYQMIYVKAQNITLRNIKHLVYTHTYTSYVHHNIWFKPLKRSHWLIFSMNVKKHKDLMCFPYTW